MEETDVDLLDPKHVEDYLSVCLCLRCESPRAMHHSNPCGGWDYWENSKYDAEVPECDRRRLRRLAAMRRLAKLKRKRRIDPNYCVRSSRNLRTLRDRRYAEDNMFGDIADCPICLKEFVDLFGTEPNDDPDVKLLRC